MTFISSSLKRFLSGFVIYLIPGWFCSYFVDSTCLLFGALLAGSLAAHHVSSFTRLSRYV